MRTTTTTIDDETRDALELTIRLHGREMLAFVASRNKSEDARDICQEACLRILTRTREPVKNITSCMYTILRNQIIDGYRKRKENKLEDVHLEIAEAELDPQLMLDRKELKRALKRAIDSLPDDQRDIFIQTEIDGRTYKEISGTTGINMNTLLARKHKAVLALRKALRTP